MLSKCYFLPIQVNKMTSGLKDKCSLHRWFSLYKCHNSNMWVYVLSQCLFSVLEYNNKQKIVIVLRKYTLMTLATLQNKDVI